MSRLLLVRHGQSTWNAVGRWQGQRDAPLSELGRRQAAVASRAVGEVDRIVSSDLDRARLTAEIIAEATGLGTVTTHPGLRERDAGAFEGLTKEEIALRFPGWLDDGRRPEGWERDESVADRAVAVLAEVSAAVGEAGTALVVTHGGVIYVLEALLGGGWVGRIPNLGARWVDLDRQGMSLGDRVHLAPDDLLTTPTGI